MGILVSQSIQKYCSGAGLYLNPVEDNALSVGIMQFWNHRCGSL